MGQPNLQNIRNSHQRCSVRKGILTNFAKFTEKHLNLFFNKVAGLSCFPVNFTKFLRTPLLQNTSGRLLLKHVSRAPSLEDIFRCSRKYVPIKFMFIILAAHFAGRELLLTSLWLSHFFWQFLAISPLYTLYKNKYLYK